MLLSTAMRKDGERNKPSLFFSPGKVFAQAWSSILVGGNVESADLEE